MIDHISDGRLMLNIVTGWNKPEIDMFGVEMLPHDERYDMAEEWLDIIKRLWTEDEEFDHEGKYYKIVKGYLQPKPIQQPFPAIMNAGGSERGRHFAAKYLRPGFHSARPARFRAQQGADRSLPAAGARGIRPRSFGLDIGEYRAGRNRSRGAAIFRLYRP